MGYLKDVSVGLAKSGKGLLGSHLFWVGAAASAALLVVSPVLAAVAGSFFVGVPLASIAVGSLLRPLSSRLFFRGTSSSASRPTAGAAASSSPPAESKKSVPQGKAVGEPMVDFLVDKMRDAGITVTTDWDYSKKVLAGLPKKYEHLKSQDVRGFVHDGVIHINPKDRLNEVPVHEYAHLWAEVLRQKNPDQWKNVVSLMKQEDWLWDHVKTTYPHLTTDDEIADEVLATYSGRRGSDLIDQYYISGDKPKRSVDGLRQALEVFWKSVCNFLGVTFTTKEEVADAILADLLKGVNPLKYATQSKDTSFAVKKESSSQEKAAQPSVPSVILTDVVARNTVGEILASVQDDGNRVHYPAHLGAVGYFRDRNDEGTIGYSCFDNRSGDCWCEDFKTEESALAWCEGLITADEARERESNVEEILFHRDSFADLLPEMPKKNPLPRYVQFDEHGEFGIELQFFDGYAIDTNPHGLSMFDRVGLYYPTVAEVAGNPDIQDMIEDYTGRCWAEGSLHEKIYDIALLFGQASRVHCPRDRYDAAVTAVVERAADPSAKAFSPEQMEKVQLAAGSVGLFLTSSRDSREKFYESLFYHAQYQLKGVPIAWAADAHEELKELAAGYPREQGLGLKR